MQEEEEKTRGKVKEIKRKKNKGKIETVINNGTKEKVKESTNFHEKRNAVFITSLFMRFSSTFFSPLKPYSRSWRKKKIKDAKKRGLCIFSYYHYHYSLLATLQVKLKNKGK